MLRKFLRWLVDDPAKFKIGGVLTFTIIFMIFFLSGCTSYFHSTHNVAGDNSTYNVDDEMLKEVK